MLLKGCPRCRGDMMLEQLPGDAEFVCLQCGFRKNAMGLIQPAIGVELERVKIPPAKSSSPWTARAKTVRLKPGPSARHDAPSQLATRFAVTPPACVKLPAAINFPS